MTGASRVLVATCGNPDAGDDAFGPRVACVLRHRAPAGVRVIELGIRPAALLDYLPGPEVLVLVDAVRADPDGTASRVLEIDLAREPLPALLHGDALSTHGLGLADQIELARRLGVLPAQVWFVGAVLESARPNTAPGAWMNPAVGEACGCVFRLCNG